jgi:hypothetical protein
VNIQTKRRMGSSQGLKRLRLFFLRIMARPNRHAQAAPQLFRRLIKPVAAAALVGASEDQLRFFG